MEKYEQGQMLEKDGLVNKTDNEVKQILEEELRLACFESPWFGKVSFVRTARDLVDTYREMKFPDLMDEYFNIYWMIFICGSYSVYDLQRMKLITREISEFRSESEKEAFHVRRENFQKKDWTDQLRGLGWKIGLDERLEFESGHFDRLSDFDDYKIVKK